MKIKKINKSSWLVFKTILLTLTAVALVIASIAMVFLLRERNTLLETLQRLSALSLGDESGMTIIFKKDILNQCGYQMDKDIFLKISQPDK